MSDNETPSDGPEQNGSDAPEHMTDAPESGADKPKADKKPHVSAAEKSEAATKQFKETAAQHLTDEEGLAALEQLEQHHGEAQEAQEALAAELGKEKPDAQTLKTLREKAKTATEKLQGTVKDVAGKVNGAIGKQLEEGGLPEEEQKALKEAQKEMQAAAKSGFMEKFGFMESMLGGVRENMATEETALKGVSKTIGENFSLARNGAGKVAMRGAVTGVGAVATWDALTRGKNSAGEDRSWVSRTVEGGAGLAAVAGGLVAGARGARF
ncbi:MAG: hypothetical protein CMM94_07655 [Rickettsiales bacterium]|nr:hypothetical protein [Rickettsiales bacterium]